LDPDQGRSRGEMLALSGQRRQCPDGRPPLPAQGGMPGPRRAGARDGPYGLAPHRPVAPRLERRVAAVRGGAAVPARL